MNDQQKESINAAAKAARAAAYDAAYNTSYAAAFKLGAAAERDRVKAILKCDAADGRASTALAFACTTDLTPAQAELALSATPKDKR